MSTNIYHTTFIKKLEISSVRLYFVKLYCIVNIIENENKRSRTYEVHQSLLLQVIK